MFTRKTFDSPARQQRGKRISFRLRRMPIAIITAPSNSQAPE
jgi:hypothetical protein